MKQLPDKTNIKSEIEMEQWRRKYLDTLIEIGGLTEEEASENFDAGLFDYDYTDDPEDSANLEMSYWDD